MASYEDPKLRVRLIETARNKVRKEHRGDKGYYDHQIGMTIIHLEQGLMYAQVSWGIDGTDSPVSPEVSEFADIYEITFNKLPVRAAGIYVLRGKDKARTVLARARLDATKYAGDDVSEVVVSGKDRKDVVKLFELIRLGKVRPDIENEEFKQIEGAVGELKRRRIQMPALERKLENREETIKSLNDQLTTARRRLSDIQAVAQR